MSPTSIDENRSFKLRPPEFDGSYDVEVFIAQFEDIAALSQWPEVIQAIKLREGLRGPAIECGRSRSFSDIIGKLRERFGVSPREARNRLEKVKWDDQRPVREQAEDIKKWISIGYPEMADSTREELAVERLIRATTNVDLRRHWLARYPGTIETAIKEARQFTELGTVESARPTIKQVEVPSSTMMDQVQAEVGQLKEMVMALSQTIQKGQLPRRKMLTDLECWHCGRKGHLRRNCPVAKRERHPKE